MISWLVTQVWVRSPLFLLLLLVQNSFGWRGNVCYLAKCFWLNVRQTSEKYRQIFNIKTENRPNTWYFKWITVFDCRKHWLYDWSVFAINMWDFEARAVWDVIFSFITNESSETEISRFVMWWCPWECTIKLWSPLDC